MAFCMNCGNQLPDGSKFCGNCGAQQGEAPVGAPAAAGNMMQKNGVVFTKADVIDFEIFGNDMQIVEIELDPGESVIAEAGAMNYMESCIKMETVFGDGSGADAGKGFGSKLLSAGKRALTGEGLFMTVFQNADPAKKAKVAFASPYPGKIIPVDLDTFDQTLICQKSAFLCAAKGVNVGIHLQKKLGAGLFGGEGFIMQKISGDGLVFIEIDGHCVEYVLGVGESLLVDTGYLAAMTESCTLDVEMVKGAKNIFLGGEGLFHTRVTGPGKVYIQTMPIKHMAEKLSPYISQPSSVNVNTGSNNSSSEQ